ncbi:MAG TPA: CDP-alcohol phosphatidyltransferase family protein, partial [Nitrospinaceae bacterium]|nr:CDP-alcohol phosphatidyltransferase family protein [Nitrospinaceae bacterium]
GLKSLLIYHNGEGAELYKRLGEEKKISIKLNWITDASEVIKSIENYPVLIFNGAALHSKQEIQSAMDSMTNNIETSLRYIERDAMTESLNQIILGNELSLTQSVGDQELSVAFLPGKEDRRMSKPQDFLTQHERLLKGSGLSNDTFMDRTVTRFFSRQFTRLFLQTPLSPNMITLLSLVIGLISALYFFQGTYENSIIGSGLLLLSAWIDCTDGEIARLKFMESKIGGKLDILCDNLVHFAVFFAIGMGLYQSTGQSIYKLAGAFAVLGSLISFLLLSASIIDGKEKASGSASGVKAKNNLNDKLANRDFIYFLFFMAMVGRMDVFICITAVGSNIFAGYLIYSRFKNTSADRLKV